MRKKRDILFTIIILMSIFIFIPEKAYAETSKITDEVDQETYEKCFNNITFNRTLLNDYKNVFITKVYTKNAVGYHLFGLKSEVKYKIDSNNAYFYAASSDEPYIQYVYYLCDSNKEHEDWYLIRYGTYDLTNKQQNLYAFKLGENTTKDIARRQLIFNNHNLIDIDNKIIAEAQEWIFEESTTPDNPEIKDDIQKEIYDAFHNYEKGAAINENITFENMREIFIRISNVKVAKITKEIWLEMPNWLWYIILGIIMTLVIIALLN